MSTEVGAAGASNAAAYRARAAGQLSNNPELSELAALFADARPSTNADGEKIQRYDAANAVLDTRSVWIARCGGDVSAGIAEFERQQGPEWLPRRQGFEDLWNGGRTFLYAAVNPGHLGLLSYGPFCIVIEPNRICGSDSAVFPGNTARRYGRTTGIPDAAAARSDVGCWEFVDDIGLAEFGDDAVPLPPAQWPELVCDDDDERFLEVVTAGPVSLDDVVEIRLSSASYADLNAWSVLERRGTLTETPKRNAVAGWQAIKRWVNITHTHIELRII